MSGPDSKRLAPFSIRFTEEERRVLERRAGKTPLGKYIKSQLFSHRQDRTSIAQALALLGKSELAKSLCTLSEAARRGALPVTSDTDAALARACQHVAEIKSILMKALRIKES